MNNRKPSKKSKSALKIEALEPRLLMSAAPDWNTQHDNLQGQVVQFVTSHAGDLSSDLQYFETGTAPVRLQDLLQMSVGSDASLLALDGGAGTAADNKVSIEEFSAGAVQNLKDQITAKAAQGNLTNLTASEVAALLDNQTLLVGNLNLTVTATTDASAPSILDLDLSLSKDLTAQTVNLGAQFKSLGIQQPSLKLSSGLHFGASISDGATALGAVEVNAYAEAQLSGTQDVDLGFVTASLTPSGSQIFSVRAESSNTVALTEQVAADLDLQITSSIQQGTGTFGGTVGLAYDSGAGQWKLDGALAGAVQNFQGVSAQDVVGQLSGLANWASSLANSQVMDATAITNLSGRLSEQVLDFAAVVRDSLSPTDPSLQLWDSRGVASSAITSLNTQICPYTELTATTGQIVCSEKTYKTVIIGTGATAQTWMAQNLAWLPSVNALGDSSSTIPKYYVYDYDDTAVTEAVATSNYNTFGVLYNYQAALRSCPTNWHLPTVLEWQTLENAVGGNSIAGTMLKSKMEWASGGATGSDEYGFSALPGGNGYGWKFKNIGKDGSWWTATASGSTSANDRNMFYLEPYLLYNVDGMFHGFSVRCLKNAN